MARTTSAAVILVLGRDYDADPEVGSPPDLTPYIDTASSIVDDVVDCAAAKDIVLSAAKLELMERWLSAHFYGQSDKPFSSKSTEGASASFHGQTGKYLESTLYGQTAVQLDSSGCLSAISEGATETASAYWLGLPRSEQRDYHQRY